VTRTRPREEGSSSLAVRIRLRRVGKTKSPHYRLVVTDSRSPRDGKFIENIGHYDPTKDDALVVNQERAMHWLKVGARPTATARDLLIKSGMQDDAVPAAVRD
jgi:small subunit ribosomal protein S16